jgi:hypothetical protein
MASWVGWWLAAGTQAAYRIDGDAGDTLTLTVVAPATATVLGRSVRAAESNVLANLHQGHMQLWRERPDWLAAGLLEGAGDGNA